MQVVMQGLYFETESPSHFALSLECYPLQAGESVEVSFLGDAWYLFHVQPSGAIDTQAFPNRDAAISFLAIQDRAHGTAAP